MDVTCSVRPSTLGYARNVSVPQHGVYVTWSAADGKLAGVQKEGSAPHGGMGAQGSSVGQRSADYDLFL